MRYKHLLQRNAVPRTPVVDTSVTQRIAGTQYTEKMKARYRQYAQYEAIPNTPAIAPTTTQQVNVMHYAALLTANTARDNSGSSREEIDSYTEDSLRAFKIDGQEVRLFAPFRDDLSARQTVTRGQVRTLSIFGIVWLLGLLGFGVNMLTATIAIIIVLYLAILLANFWLSTRTLNQSPEEQIDDAIVHALADVDWPCYTILCPLYRETEVLTQFVQAMNRLDYPIDKLQILLLTEEDDSATRDAIRAMYLPPHFCIITVPDGQPRTKPRACNFGLLQAIGDYVVIYDAEDIPDPLQLKKAVLTFASHDADLACVQAKLNYYNPNQNLLTRWFTVEYSLWFDMTLPGMQDAHLPIPLGGTSNHFRTSTLRELGAWDAFNVTEDCDLGLRMAHFHLRTAILDSTTYEEANSRVKNWLRQRSRWIKGYMQTYLVHMRHPLRYLSSGRLREFLSLQLVVGGKTIVLLINPLMWLLLAIYIIFHPVALYHTLFPAPVLYMGTLCFIFGNFFYAYSHLIGCLKRGQYGLIKWALSVPFYWLMISMAAFIALFQLVFKPHYWEKTQHGLHLSTSPSFLGIASGQRNSVLPTASVAASSSSTVSTPLDETQKLIPLRPASLSSSHNKAFVADSLSADRPKVTYESSVDTLNNTPAVRIFDSLPSTPAVRIFDSLPSTPSPDLSVVKRPSLSQLKHQIRRYWPKDSWLIATFVIACIASITSCWYFFQHHEILLYGDSMSHLRIARRIVDNTVPGLAQLGGVWLPFPHLLMLPFIWNYYLWRTGLAGSFAGMLSYLVAVVYLFLAARRLTHNSRASFVGTLLFILNLNILYLQATPLSEIVCVATTVMTCYYFLAWTQDNQPKHLVGMAASSFLVTLSRYDGWGLFLTLLVLIVIVGWIKRQRWVQIEGNLLIFGTLGSLGIALWFLWCAVIFGDPFYFHDYLFSSVANAAFYTYHNLWQSILSYMLTSILTIGPILFVLGCIGVVVFVFRLRRTPNLFGALAFLTPFAFYILIFYTGQDTIYLPGLGPANTPHYFWNVRFGVQTVAPAALFLSILAMHWSNTRRARFWTVVSQLILVLVIGMQTLLTAHTGIISLQDGLYGASCEPTEQITIYLAQHYTSGQKILEDVNAFPINEADIGMPLKDAIYEGSGEQWQKALKNPASVVDWIIVPPGLQSDLIVSHINLKSRKFLSQFTLVVQQPDGRSLFQRNGLSPLPTRPIPSYLLTEHQLCG